GQLSGPSKAVRASGCYDVRKGGQLEKTAGTTRAGTGISLRGSGVVGVGFLRPPDATRGTDEAGFGTGTPMVGSCLPPMSGAAEAPGSWIEMPPWGGLSATTILPTQRLSAFIRTPALDSRLRSVSLRPFSVQPSRVGRTYCTFQVKVYVPLFGR